jgi:hypothetical protein
VTSVWPERGTGIMWPHGMASGPPGPVPACRPGRLAEASRHPASQPPHGPVGRPSRTPRPRVPLPLLVRPAESPRRHPSGASFAAFVPKRPDGPDAGRQLVDRLTGRPVPYLSTDTRSGAGPRRRPARSTLGREHPLDQGRPVLPVVAEVARPVQDVTGGALVASALWQRGRRQASHYSSIFRRVRT